MGSVAMALAMFRCSSLILIFLSWTLVLAQNNNNKKLFGDEKKTLVKRGPDGRPLLFGPDIEKCKTRTSRGKLGGHHYFLSWREPWHKFEDWDWFNGRNFCRERCMDLVSFENPTEFRMFEEVMIADNISSIYTSGRKCNFQGKGCEGAIFDPINVNGWFWPVQEILGCLPLIRHHKKHFGATQARKGNLNLIISKVELPEN